MMTTLDFWSQLEIQCMENTIVIDSGDTGRPIRAFRGLHIVEYHLEKVPNYRKKWLPSAEKSKYPSRNIRISAAQTIQNAGTEHILISDAPNYCFRDMDASQIIR